MNKSEVVKLYSMEELIPIVGELAEKFTSKESSSITYERARQLMEAVIYCIAHLEEGNMSLMIKGMPSAKDAYAIGYDAVMRKVAETRQKYNKLMTVFDHYGNQNYRDTVKKALPGFFLYYDVRFAPTENIITMDYPIFGLDMTLEGIDMIAQYIDAILKEQCFLMQFPRNDVIEKLRSFHRGYEKEYFNLKEILTRFPDHPSF